jgi:cytochrome c-type biogenesis protein CcmF
MEIGGFFLAWAAVPLILAMAGYFLVAVGNREFRLGSRVIYWFLFGMVAIALADLLHLFLTDQFQFSYVASYSSRDLSNSWPHFFKLSALWGGQQGTFLMWLAFGLILGFWVKSRARENEGWVMFFYMLGQTFLLVLTIVSNPFQKLNFIPADGQGLNPLLQNYWMQIHPPIVFIGFASACIPFAFAMASLASDKYENWVRQTMPWVVFTVVTLGFGIFLGGYWAYETLGWGGYWAWDPVENASLIPWLVSIALLHGMVVERSRGTWRRTNLFLAITLFLMIIYGTFLTRSGVLADFSVHSFVDLGYTNLLWISIIVIGLISYGLWAYRAHRMKVASSTGTEILSQEFSTFLAMVLLLPFTMLVLFWTSFPLVTGLMSKLPLLSKVAPAPAGIDPSNYNMVGIIFALIFSTILGFNALLGWKSTDKQVLKKKVIAPAVIAFVISAVIVIFGFSKIAAFWSDSANTGVTANVYVMAVLYFLFFLTALFAFNTNLLFLIGRWKKSFIAAGGYITHLGFSLLLIGIIISSTFGTSRKLTVPEGSSRAALGYDITFTGTARTAPTEETAYFELAAGDDTVYAHSVSKEVRRGQQIQYARTPHIKKFLTHDLYLSLENLADPNAAEMRPFELHPGESTDIMGYTVIFEGYDSDEQARRLAEAQPVSFQLAKGDSHTIDGMKITFQEFDMGEHQMGMTGGIGAKLLVEYGGKTDTVTPFYRPSQGGEFASEPVKLPSGGFISVLQIRADIGSVVLSYAHDTQLPDIDVATVVKVVAGNDTTTVMPVFNPSEGHREKSMATLPDGGRLFLLDLQAADNLAHFMLDPARMPLMASIEVSIKPMINLVWIGFLIMVAGAVVAVFRRMSEARIKRR